MMLRRPCTLSALSFAAGAAAAGLSATHRNAVFLFYGGGAAALLLFLCLQICKYFTPLDIISPLNKKIAAGTLLFTLFFTVGFADASVSFSKESQLTPCSGQFATVSGTVLNASRNAENTVSATIRLCSGELCRCGNQVIRQHNEKILLKLYDYKGIDPRLLTGCRVSVQGTVTLPQPAANPGGFDYRLFLRSQKIYAFITTDKITKETSVPTLPLLHGIARFKVFYEEKIFHSLKEDSAGLLCGILFGDQETMDEELTDSFRQNGTGHLLAASGLHVGFVYAFLYFIFRKPRSTAGNLPILFILCLYTALAGFSSSVVRSVFMITVRILSRTTVQRYDFLTSISFCALILLAYEPALLFSAGFLLSFTAVSSLAVLLPAAERLIHVRDQEERMMLPFEKIRYHFKKTAVNTIALTIAIQLGMMPVTLKLFHYISPAGLILNLPSIELAGLIVPAGIVLIPLSFGPDFLYMPVAILEEMLLRLLLTLNRLLADSGISCLYRPSPLTGLLLMFYVLLFLCCCETGQRIFRFFRSHYSRSSVIACLLLFSAIVSICAGAGYTCDRDFLKSNLIFVDVGQGDCTHLKNGNVNLLFDSGGSTKKDIGEEILMPYFLGNGVNSIDMAIISHLHTDHYEGLKTLSKYVNIRKLLVSKAYRSKIEEISADIGVPSSAIYFVSQGDQITVEDTVIDVLAPKSLPEEEFARLADLEDEENDCSLVTRATVRGVSVLFTGDIDETLEKDLIISRGSRLSSDILKVPHHGSKYSSSKEFLDMVQPSVSVIQVGRNLYGHPSPEALRRLEASGSAVYRNDLQGAVMIQISGNKSLMIRTMKQTTP